MTDENETDQEGLETDADEGSEPEHRETAEESAREAWKEVFGETPDGKEAFKPKEEPEVKADEDPDEISEAAKKLAGAKKGKRRQTFVPEGSGPAPAEKFEAPQSWEVKDKEWFHAQPPEVQKNAVQWFKNAQAQTTKVWQELSRERDAAKEVNQVLESHWKDLGIPSHFTKGQVVDQLLQYQKRINEDSTGAILEMMQHRGVSLEALHARATGEAPAPRQPAQQQIPQNSILTADQLERILEEREQRTNQSRTVESATEEVRGLAREMQNGKYLWPEMHSAENIQRIQPLVTYFRETNPTLTWGEWYRKAITQDRVNRGVASPSPQVSRLTPENIQTVRQASSSLRSRGGNGAIPRMSEPKAKETARESAEAAYYEVFGNKQH